MQRLLTGKVNRWKQASQYGGAGTSGLVAMGLGALLGGAGMGLAGGSAHDMLEGSLYGGLGGLMASGVGDTIGLLLAAIKKTRSLKQQKEYQQSSGSTVANFLVPDAAFYNGYKSLGVMLNSDQYDKALAKQYKKGKQQLQKSAAQRQRFDMMYKEVYNLVKQAKKDNALGIYQIQDLIGRQIAPEATFLLGPQAEAQQNIPGTDKKVPGYDFYLYDKGNRKSVVPYANLNKRNQEIVRQMGLAQTGSDKYYALQQYAKRVADAKRKWINKAPIFRPSTWKSRNTDIEQGTTIQTPRGPYKARAKDIPLFKSILNNKQIASTTPRQTNRVVG